MSLREFLNELEKEGNLKRITQKVDPNLEISRILSENYGSVVLFENVKDSRYRIVGGVCSSRENFVNAFKLKKNESLLRYIANTIEKTKEPEIVKKAPCQEVVENNVDLSSLPIVKNNSKDMGPYITAGVFIAQDPEYGSNLSFHRASPITREKLVARICQRDLYHYLERTGNDLDIAICIGLQPSVLLAAGISLGIEVNELEIANSFYPLNIVKCKTNDIYVPADSEIVLEGRITKERHEEGPFVDITGTYDIVRKEPVIEINCITHRKNAIYQTILPSSSEHKLLMGMPKEPAIYKEVNKVCNCKDVLLTKGGCSWLHGIVKIEKKNKEDGKKAIKAAFKAYGSLKHVVVLDDDIDIHNKEEVEWAIATRFQAGKDLVMKKEKGSSLDPSSDEDRTTYKVGIDATIPWDKKKRKFIKARFGE